MNKIVNGVANDYEFPFLEKTTENYMQVIDGTGMYYEWYVKHLQQELQRKDNIINELKQNKRDYERENVLEMKLHILDNNWNELKEWLDKRSELTNMGIVLDKIKELEKM